MPNNKPHAVPGSEKDRADGWYWVIVDEWRRAWEACLWGNSAWLYRGRSAADDFFFEIGPRIPSPDEQPAPVERPEELSYGAYKNGACTHCDSGNPQIDNAKHGLRHILVDRGSWAESVHVSCTALPLSEWSKRTIVALEAQVRELQAEKDAETDRLEWLIRTGAFLLRDEEGWGVNYYAAEPQNDSYPSPYEAIDAAKGGKL